MSFLCLNLFLIVILFSFIPLTKSSKETAQRRNKPLLVITIKELVYKNISLQN